MPQFRRSLVLLIAMSVPFVAGDGTEIKFQQQDGTGLNEILMARRVALEQKKGNALRGHEWWLWGLSAFDYDLDNDLDLIVCIHGSMNGLIIKNLRRETGQLRFVDVTSELGVDGVVPSTDDYPLVWDFDGDGDLDIAGLLDDTKTPCLLNEGGKRFVKASYSLHPINHPAGVTDLNGDGYLDIFQVRRGKRIECLFDPTAAVFKKVESPFTPGFKLPEKVAQEIADLRSQKNNRFIKFRYIGDHDLNSDGRKDLVISGFGSYSGDRVGRYLWGSEDSTYVEASQATGLPKLGAPFHFQDIDQDQDVDVLIASSDEAGLYLNVGRGRFERKAGPLTDFVQQRCPYLHVAMPADLDNDGDLDLAISNRRYGRQKVFENRGDGNFEVVLESRGWDADPLVLCDMNDDGRMDVIIGGSGDKENIGVFLNTTPATGNFCRISPKMKSPNVYGAGTRIEVFAAGALGKKTSLPKFVGHASLDGSPIHVGLGADATFDMKVTFPGKPAIEHQRVSAGRWQVSPDGKIQTVED